MIPIRQEKLRLSIGGAAGRPAKLLAIGREDRQAIEAIGEGDAHRFVLTRRIHQVELEIRKAELVGGEDHVLGPMDGSTAPTTSP